ncbi:helix-turn-helix transcriptional regulator [Chishuiella changwenlii]|uniref:response regulator transcription factor n=1 Tax=Chishuiella changwenlii TaxID=1434701 RepID=UPI002FD88C7C
MAYFQAKTDNSIAVLTDYYKNYSYLYTGNLGKLIGIEPGIEIIDSAFEDILFCKINKQDLEEKKLLDIEYYKFLKDIPLIERSCYHTSSFLRIETLEKNIIELLHKTFFIKSFSNGSVWLSLCLYSISSLDNIKKGIEGKIINNETGKIVFPNNNYTVEKINLSVREIEVLQLLLKGYKSKHIAKEIHLSVNTIYRHRQNILEKLNVRNTPEAINKAITLGIIKV